jgi:hypothetical protein
VTAAAVNGRFQAQTSLRLVSEDVGTRTKASVQAGIVTGVPVLLERTRWHLLTLFDLLLLMPERCLSKYPSKGLDGVRSRFPHAVTRLMCSREASRSGIFPMP